MSQTTPSPSPAASPSTPPVAEPIEASPLPVLKNAEELRIEMIGREYDNFNQSSFHSDGLRNQIIQFYLILVGAAATAIVGIAQLQAGGATQPLWPFSVIAIFIGGVGILMLPIFVRLRRVVLECLTGTVLLKRYAERVINATGDTLFNAAMLWDAKSLPLDENYFTASFVLVLMVMVLSSVMIALGVFLRLFEVLLAGAQELYPAIWWSVAIGFGVLLLQVIGYRAWLWHEIRKFIRNDDLRAKWRALEIIDAKVNDPALWRPILEALTLLGVPTIIFFVYASSWLNGAELLRLLTMGLWK